jgi:DNA-binding transcriptional ArsR family regulator
MDRIASALGDATRWRIVELLTERPRSVGELAELTGVRQPQTTKHLQTLARAGLVTVTPLGQRRVYAVETAPLTALLDRLRVLVETIESHQGEQDVIARYRACTEAESADPTRRHREMG